MTARRLAGVLPPSVTQRSSSSLAAGLGPATDAAGCFATIYPATSSPFSRRRNQLRLSVGSSTPRFARPARKILQCIFADRARSRTPTRKKPSLLAKTRDAAQFSDAHSSHACRCSGVSAGRPARKLLRATVVTVRRACVPVAIYRGCPVPDSSREATQPRPAVSADQHLKALTRFFAKAAVTNFCVMRRALWQRRAVCNLWARGV
jgi:hypothetical protein